MRAHTVQWVTASPLWSQVVGADGADDDARQRMRRPALLRFDTDDFMDGLAELLEDDPARLAELVARPESARRRPPGTDGSWQPRLDRLRLYQAAHGRFYLVAATLTCRVPGLPEHVADPARREVVGFVLRRLHDGAEWGWATAAGTRARGWLAVAPGAEAAVAPGEELLPLHPANYLTADRRRRFYVGLVPTSSRETFAAAGPLAPVPPEPARGEPRPDLRLEILRTRLVEPVLALPPVPPSPGPVAAAVNDLRTEVSRFALLDLAELVRACLPTVWAALTGDAPAPVGDPPPGAAGDLVAALRRATVGDGTTTWARALTLVWEQRLAVVGEGEGPVTLQPDLGRSTPGVEALADLVRAALPPLSSPEGSAGVDALRPADAPPVPKLEPGGDGVYVLRCVYRRPDCAPSHRDVVSDRTAEFTIAPYFDLDAPVRPVMVSMPLGTSLKDLRRYPKGVSFLLSDELSRSMSQVSSLKDALDGKAGAGRPLDLGMICAFSIPIITMVALILLMVVVSLLNFVFAWVPYLRICLPVPLKAKR